MLKYRVFMACGVLAACCMAAARQPQGGEHMRKVISVAVTVRDDAEVPIGNVPLALFMGGTTAVGTTSSTGEVTLRVALVQTDELRGSVRLYSVKEALSPDRESPESLRINELRGTHSFPFESGVVVGENENSQQIIVRAPRAIQMTTRFVKSNGDAVAGSCWVVGKMAWEKLATDGSVVLKGLPPASVSQVALRVKGQRFVHVVEVDASTFTDSFVLADQVVEVPSRTIPVAGQVSGMQVFRLDPLLSGSAVTLVSSSGDQWYEFGVNADGAFDVPPSGSNVICPGTYYAVPGSGGLGRYAAEVQRLIKAGRSPAELETAGIVKVVVATGAESASVVLDMGVVRSAITSFGGVEW